MRKLFWKRVVASIALVALLSSNAADLMPAVYAAESDNTETSNEESVTDEQTPESTGSGAEVQETAPEEAVTAAEDEKPADTEQPADPEKPADTEQLADAATSVEATDTAASVLTAETAESVDTAETADSVDTAKPAAPTQTVEAKLKDVEFVCQDADGKEIARADKFDLASDSVNVDDRKKDIQDYAYQNATIKIDLNGQESTSDLKRIKAVLDSDGTTSLLAYSSDTDGDNFTTVSKDSSYTLIFNYKSTASADTEASKPEPTVKEDRISLSAAFEDESGTAITAPEGFALPSFSDTVDTLTFADVAPSISGYTFREAKVNGSTAASIKKSSKTDETTNVTTISYSAVNGKDASSVSGDVTVTFIYTADEKPQEPEVKEITLSAKCVDEDGKKLSGAALDFSSDSVDLTAAPQDIDGYTFTEAQINGSKATSLTRKGTTSKASDGSEKTVYTYSYTNGSGETIELTGDTTVEYVYKADKKEEKEVKEYKLTASYVSVDADGKESSIDGQGSSLPSFDGDTLDVSGSKLTVISGYYYDKATIGGRTIDSISRATKSVDTTDEDGNKTTKDITVYSYTADGKTTELTEDTTVKFLYKPVKEVKEISVTASCLDEDGNALDGYEKIDLPAFDSDGSLVLNDKDSAPAEVKGYTYAKARIGKTVIDSLSKETKSVETTDENGETSKKDVTVYSYTADGKTTELTDDTVVKFVFTSDEEEKYDDVKVTLACVDQRDDAIRDYEKIDLPAFDDKLVLGDTAKTPVAIEGYDYVEAKIGDTVLTSVSYVTKTVKVTDEDGNETTKDVKVYSYTSDGVKKKITEDTTITLTYQEQLQDVKLTAACVDENGASIEDYASVDFPAFDGRIALDDTDKAPIEIKEYFYKDAKIDGSVVTAITSKTEKYNDKDYTVYYYTDKNGDSTELKADTTVTLDYEAADKIVKVDATCVDEFGDPIAKDKTDTTYQNMQLPAFDADGYLALDDTENPPVAKVQIQTGLFKVTKYTYVQATIDNKIIKGLKKEEAKLYSDSSTGSNESSSTAKSSGSLLTAAAEAVVGALTGKTESADVTSDSGNYVYSYTTDGSTWTKITADTTVKFEYTDGKKTVFTYEDDNVLVTATLQHAGAVPDDAELKVTPVTSTTDGYNYDAYMQALNDNADTIAAASGDTADETADAAATDSTGDTSDTSKKYNDKNTLLYDIAFMADKTDADGNVIDGEKQEYEPTEGMVSISMTFKQKQLTDDIKATSADDITVVHMPLTDDAKENVDSTADATDISASDVKIETLSDSAIVGDNEQVDFATEGLSLVALTVTNNNPPLDKDWLFFGENNYYEFTNTYTDADLAAIGKTASDIKLEYHYVNDDSETFAQSKFYNPNLALGVAGNFHIVAFGTAKLEAHTNGNILCNNLEAGSNFGTNSYDEISAYIAGTYSQVNGSSGLKTSNPLCLGTSNGITFQDNGNSFAIGTASSSTKLDRPHIVYRDGTKNFIDIAQVKRDITSTSTTLSEMSSTVGSNISYVTDGPTGTYTLSDPDGVGVISLSAAEVNALSSKDLHFKGFESGHNGSIIVNVDCSNGNVTLPTRAYVYIDGVQQGTGEVTDFSAGKVIWNFKNCAGTTITAQNMSGTIIAIGASVELTQNINGTIIAENTHNTAETHRSDFTGKINGDSTSFNVSKTFSSGSWPTGSTYNVTFSRLTADAPLPSTTSLTLSSGASTKGFGDISYLPDTAKTGTVSYYYKIYEESGTVSGVSYDPSIYYIKVNVKYDNTIDHTATITGTYYSKQASAVTDYESLTYTAFGKNIFVFGFSNSYGATGGVSLSATKTLSGKTLAAEQFSFELKDSAGKVLQTKKNTADGAVSFDEISYTQADVANSPITYTINEVIPDPKAAGYTYDSSVYSVSVALTDDGAGKITATPTYYRGTSTVESASFGNSYASSGKVILQATKTLSGRTLAAEQFSFELKDSTGTVLQTKKNTADGTVSFDEISYTQADVANSPITYTINEVIPDPKAAGYTYDSSVYSVSVALTDDGTGKITATPTYYKGTSTVESASFGNSYASSGKVILQATKTLSGKTLAAEQFSFELKDSTGTVLQTKKNTADGTVNFDEISYTQADVANSPITYTINEVIPDPKAAGYTYDSSVYSVSVALTDDGAGKITATPTYYKGTSTVESASFGNSYASSGKVSLQATKTLSGRTLAAEQFSFELKDSAGKVLQTKKNTADGTVSFDKISYTQADVANSPITYTINEVIPDPKAAGYTYDSSVYSVSVALTDDGTGKITATPTYYKGTSTVESASFGNSYASSGKVRLQATKTLSGRTLAAEQFSFELKDSTGKVLQTKKNTADGAVSFDEISYTQADVANSPITYTINEVIPDPKAAGYTYDSSVYSVSVALTDDGTGKITATPTYYKGTSTVESASFGNSYASSGKVILQAAKTLSGKTLAAEQFSFELKDSTGKVLQTKKNTADGAVSFDEISYTQADVANSPITYTINEVIPDPKAAGYTYDSSVYSVSVALTDDGTGKITATPTYYKGTSTVESVSFGNSYASSGKVILQAAKTLSGKTLAAEQFSFELKDSTGKVLQTKKNTADGAVSFDEISYTQADVANSPITYTINEVIPDPKAAGYTYDSSVYSVSVALTDDGTGKITATPSYKKDGNAVSAVTFGNAYAGSGEVILQATKTLSGKTLAAEQFSFELKDSTGKVLQTKKNTAGGAVSFDKISYTQADVANSPITYTINEVIPDPKAAGYTYDSSVYSVSVALTDDGAGKITATPTYYKGTSTVESASFGNSYASSGKVILQAAKTLSGKTLAAEQFSFELKDSTGKVLQTKKNTADGAVSFDEISYTQADVANSPITYTINEVIPDPKAAGYTYDSSVYSVSVVLTDDGAGKITATPSYKKDGNAVSAVTFGNAYAGSGEVILQATKTLSGKTLAAEQFSFELKDSTGKVLQTKKNTAGGAVSFDKISYTQADVANSPITYTINEVIPDPKAAGYTYDNSVYSVSVALTDDGAGKITATPTYYKGTSTVESASFGNSYASSGKVRLQAAKTLSGRTLAAEQFSFELKDSTGKVLQTKKNTADGAVSFDEISYTQADVANSPITYTINEVIPDPKAAGYTYDSSVYSVSVALTDDGAGKITATPSYKKDGNAVSAVTFGNAYAGSGEVILQATKTLSGKTLAAEQFSFELKDSTGKVLQTKKNTAGGAVSFDKISYTQADVANSPITYTINEVIPDPKAVGYTYDNSVYSVSVALTDDGTGKITATPTYYKGTSTVESASFGNSYASSGKVILQAAKTLSGKTLAAEQFSFELKDSTGKVLQTKKNTADGAVSFDEISYTQADVANSPITYTINEVIPDPKAAGYTYDSSVYSVSVVLTDDGAGKITATPSYKKDGNAVSAVTFGNAYAGSGEVILQATKTLSGKTLAAEQFSFELKDSTGKVLQTKKNTAGGAVSFDKISYTQADVANSPITYTINEVIPDPKAAGYTYDSSVYSVSVALTDDGAGKITATPTYYKGTSTVESASFGNSYASSGKVILQAAKTLSGRTLAAEQFSFELKDSTGTVLQTKKNTADGTVSFDEISYTQADVANSPITYTINEVIPDPKAAGYTYDSSVYSVSVVLTDDGAGKITATPSYKKDGNAVSAVTFGNAYAGSGEVILQATKTLSGKTLAAEQFSFELKDSTGKVLQTKKNTAGGAVSFDKISYTQADVANSPITYTINEVIPDPKAAGYTYDSSVYSVSVALTDDGAGKITATPTYYKGTSTVESASFGNSYASSGKVILQAAKTLSGRTLAAEQFSFELKDSTGTVLQTKKNTADGTVSFDEISYTQADVANSPITYTINEVIPDPKAAGYTYDSSVYSVSVALTDDGTGKITATPTYYKGTSTVESASFGNSYASSGKVILQAAKTLSGKTLAAEQFSFELKDSAGKVLQTKKNTADGAVSFDEISYTQADVANSPITYTINEVIPDPKAAGYTYDSSVYSVSVALTDDGAGKITATPTYYRGTSTVESASFGNSYASSGKVILQATKTLSGRTLAAEQFSFELKDSTGTVLQTKKNTADGTVSFDEISYTQADVANSPITYTINEVIPDPKAAGYTYDSSVYSVSVALTDDGTGKITATPTYYKGTSTVESASFGNSYASSGKVILQATKTLSGKTLAAEQFSFELKDSTGTVLQTKKNTADGTVNFDEISYTQADVANSPITYTINEVIPDPKAAGYTYDSSVYSVSVALTDDGAGKITATPTYYKGTSTVESASFGNSYASSGKVSLQATKTLSGRTLAAEQFSFELKDSAGKVLQTKKNTADGTVSFDKISYTQADVANSPITYTINEVIPDPKAAGYTYDSSVYSVSVALTDDGTGKITATPTYYKGTSTVESASFGNSYASSGKVRLQATKTLSGRTLAAEQFSFELKDSTGKVLQTKKNTADGAVSFDEISYTQADVANSPITYTINEVIPDPKAAGYTYDSSVYSVSVALTDDGTGKITATPSYKKDGNAVSAVTFGNAYAGSGEVILQATKTLSGKTLAAEQFSFELKDSTGKVLQTKKNTAGGAVSFDKISYTQADVANSPITYTINEVIPDPKAAGYTYDSSVYSVSVALTDDGTGKITATPTYYKGTSTVESASFGNSYASSGKVILQAAKTLSGKTLAAEQFSFELKDSTGKVLQTKKNTADGAVSFDEISYTQADVANSPITYTINEVIPDPKAAGYTYDSSVYSVSVVLTDDGAGKITATPSYKKDGNAVSAVTFGNAYAGSGEVILQATKTLSGKTLAAEQFSFELKDSTGKVLQTKKNTAGGAVSFDKISYTQADVANSPITYTINEVIPDPKAAGYTYDNSVYSVSVALTDDGAGKITATPTYYKGTSTVESASFGNSYASSGKVRLQAAKTLSGRTLAAEQFSFELKDSTGKVLQTKKNTADGAVSFDEISYTQADVANSPITYTINEVIPDPKAAGYTYDSSVYSVSVALTDDGAGKITATPSYKKDGNAVSAVTFGNAYAGSGEVILQATKTLSGKTLAAEQFSFELKDSTGKVLQTKKNTAGGAVSFDKISYTQADVANSPITYTINEVIPDPKAAGYTYDSSVYSVSVALTDDGAGKITATPTYYKGTSTVESASFGNSYASSGKVILQAAKTLSGRTLAAEQFSFELKDSTGTVLQTKKNTADGTVSFDEISYTQADVANSPITYTINEVIPDPKAAGYTYDSSVYSVSVVLTDDGAGKITATPSYKKDGNAVSAVTFGNAYAGSGEVILQATKTLSGKTLAAEQFSFELKDSTGKVLQTKKNTAGGAVSFDKISYTQADVANSPITYTINEVIPDPKAAGYTYDSSVYSVSVALTDDGAGKITATPTYYKGTSTVESASFGNSYASSGKVILQAAKTLSGRTLAAEQFSFELKDSTGTVLQTKKNTADGTVSFDEISYTQADVANSPITYTINEVIPDPKAAGYTYDSSVYSVSVALTDDGTGKITATPTYYKGTSTVESASFGNSYASSGKVILQAAKTLSGKTLAAEQFSFELKDSTGKVLQTKKNTADGAVSFDEISYTQADVANSPITYTINEVIPDPKAAGYTYDSSVYSVSVVLTDDGAGKITATPSYKKDGKAVSAVIFENKYTKKYVYFSKVAAGQSTELKGASLAVTKGSDTIASWISGGDAKTLELDYNVEYTMVEKGAPAGYDIANSITFKINEKGEIEIKQSDGSYKTNENGSTVKMIDELTKYKVTVSKTDLNGAEVEGAKLVVKDSNGKTVDSWTSGSGKDNAHVVTVTMGTYTLHEDLQPAGYDLANDITFKVDEKGNITVNGKEVSDITMIDVLSTGNLVIYKTTNGATTPADTTFTITGPNGYSKTVKYSEFSNGQYKLTKLEPGDYKVTESTGSAAVSGYTLSVTGNNATATVTKNGEVPLGITNNYNKINTGSLSIVKTTTGAATPAGTTFTITGPNSFSKTVTYGDFTNGVYTITDLVPGDYTVTEDTGSAAVSGYTLTVTGNGGTATVAADANVSLGITNTYTNNKTGSLMIVKTSAGATTPAGTVFTITGPNGYSKTVTYSQFTGGRYTLTDLVPGTYTVTENRDSAVIASYALTVTGDGAAAAVTAGKTATVGIINTYTAGAGNLIVTKISNGTSTPTGTTFTITGPNGFSKTVTYGEFAGGSYMLSNLVPGNYTVTEDSGTAQVANYTLTVSGDGSTAAVTAGGTGTVTITNNYTTTTPKTGSVDLVKLDSENGALLAGAVFDLHRGDGSVYGTYTTDSNGHITVSGLPYGSYYFIETAAPSGYQIDETRIDFTISDGSGVRESVWLNFTNTKTGHVRGARRGYDRNGNVLGAKRGNAKGANRVATGDDSQMVLYGSISAAAAAALVGWILVNRKKKKKDQGEGSNN